MDARTTISRCSKCEDLQKQYLTALKDKRAILVRLQNELEQGRKLREELDLSKEQGRHIVDKKRLEDNASGSTSLIRTDLESRLAEAMIVNRKWKEEYDDLKEKSQEETTKLKEEIKCLIEDVKRCNTNIHILESENLRLAKALSVRGDSSISQNSNCDDPELMKFQMQAYKDDFSCERRDREKAQSEKDNLQEQLSSAQEIIATLTEEIEVYKVQHDNDKDEIRRLMNRQQITQPQLQIVYPIIDTSEQRRENRWRQQQQRRGIYTRGPTLPPPSVFYGGDVEVDQPDGSRRKPSLTDGYNSV